MLTEHDMGRGYVRGMSEAIAKYKAGDGKASSAIVGNARNYIALLTQHIDKEDNILYPMADVHLSEDKQKELLEEFERVERERIGVGKHEEFHELLDHLKQVYQVM
jgi:hemerythrin-like domain-containing protein